MKNVGWMMALSACVLAYLVLSFHVGAIKSRVHLAEREIVALEREKIILETEFQTRANQQQLANWNRLEFGYNPPSAEQYLESERQLASLGQDRPEGAPAPIRVAQHPDEEVGILAMVSPVTGKPLEDDDLADMSEPAASEQGDGSKKDSQKNINNGVKPASLADRLTREISLRDPSVEMAP